MPDDPAVQKTLGLLGIGNSAKMPKPMQLVIAQLAFANSDFAFQGNHLFQGNFYGVNFYDISDPAKVSLITSLVCPGGQGDVSVYGNLLFMSVEMPNGRLDCGTQGFPPPPPPPPGHEKERPHARRQPGSLPRRKNLRYLRHQESQAGWRRPDLPRLAYPYPRRRSERQGQRLHLRLGNIVRAPEGRAGRLLRRGSGQRSQHLALPHRRDQGSARRAAGGEDRLQPARLYGSAHRRAERPQQRRQPRQGAEKPADTNQCHDITVYSAIGLAAGACSGNGILLDIKDPVHPKRVDAVNDPNYSYWHSATFSNDGTKVVFTDEWGGGLQPRCRATDPNKWGADAIFNLKDDKLSLASYYKMPAAQTATENCVAHNGSLVPIPGRDIEVQAWYQGGISVMDFTDPAHPYEIAYFDRGPIEPDDADPRRLLVRLLVQRLHLRLGDRPRPGRLQAACRASSSRRMRSMRPTSCSSTNSMCRTSRRSHGRNSLTVARAYLDQLQRSKALPADQIASLDKAIQRTQKSHNSKKDLAKLHTMAASVETDASSATDPADAKRLHALAQILDHPAA